MLAAQKFRKDKESLTEAFKKAIQSSPDTPDEQPPPHYTLWSLIGLSLIGTMLPFKVAVIFFSLVAVTSFIITLLLILKKQLRFNKPASGALVALLATSILSGCAPALFSKNSPELLQLIKDREYKYFSLQKYGIFGLGLDEVTIENAQFEGDIETVYVAKLEHGYGIVSVSRMTVAGK